MAFQVTTLCGGILLNTLQALSMPPHFEYMSMRLHPTKTWDSKPPSMICWWACLLSLSAPKPAHALITWKKVNMSGLIHSHCIYQKSCITFLGCPWFTYFVSFLFHAKMFNWIVPCAVAVTSAATNSRFPRLSSQSPSCVFLCLKSRYQKSRSNWSAMWFSTSLA